jgi:hypothetical protein
MNRRTLQIGAIVLALVLASLACSFNVSTASVENVRMARDQEGAQPTTTYNPNEPFYLVGEMNNAPDDTVLKVVWTAVNVEGEEPNTVIQEIEEQGGSGPFWFNLTSNSGIWPPGTYKADLYLNDELNTTLEFEVVSG